jgi:hypothetical protein
MSDDFITRSKLALGELTREDASLSDQEEGIRRRRVDIKARMATLAQAMETYREVMKVPAPSESPKGPEPIARSYPVSGGTMADIAFSILAANDGRMRMMDLIRELQIVGKVKSGPTGPSEYGTVYSTLKRDSRFVKAGPGEFALAPNAPKLPL